MKFISIVTMSLALCLAYGCGGDDNPTAPGGSAGEGGAAGDGGNVIPEAGSAGEGGGEAGSAGEGGGEAGSAGEGGGEAGSAGEGGGEAGAAGEGGEGGMLADLCATDNGGCDTNATCTQDGEAVTCVCNAGYEGDGATCADIDECVTDNGGCDANATCTNADTAGDAPICACIEGYEGDGTTCLSTNVVVTLTVDAYFGDAAWSLEDADGNVIRDGAAEASGEAVLGFALTDGEYCFNVTDSFGDGGVGGTVAIDGQLSNAWTGLAYATTQQACFTVMSALYQETGALRCLTQTEEAPCTPNVKIDYTTDTYPRESIVVLTTGDGVILSVDEPQETNTDYTLEFELNDGRYCVGIYDAFSDGGVSASITVGDAAAVALNFVDDSSSPQFYCFTLGLDCAGVDAGNSVTDACGVCDDDPTNDGSIDACGTCDADPTNDCVADCNGVLNGPATLDACGTCDEDPSNDCIGPALRIDFETDLFPGESSWDVRNASDEVVASGVFTVAYANSTEALNLLSGDYCFNIYDDYEDGGLSAVLTFRNGDTMDVNFIADAASPQTYCFAIEAVNDCAGVLDGAALVDACGVCDDDPTNDGAVDGCGTCDADPTNDCVADCNGDFGGTASLDNCGTCDDDPTNDCVATPVVLTFTTDSYPNESRWELTDAITSDVIAQGLFTESNTTTEEVVGLQEGQYCISIFDSFADGGVSALVTIGDREPVDLDFLVDDSSPQTYCFTIGLDCAGVDGGAASEDQCGVCDEDPTNDCVADCNGDFGGTAALDACGTCDEDPTNDCVSSTLSIEFTTDTYPNESSWQITDEFGTPLVGDAYSGSFTVSNTTTTETVELGAGNYCLSIFDTYADGGVSALISIDGAEAVSLEFNENNDSPASYCFQIGAVEDCSGVLNGDSTVDQCGTCDNDPTNDCVQDCEGVFGGPAVDCGNVTVWLTCDENLSEVRWGLVDENGVYLSQGEPEAMSSQYIPLGYTLDPGTYYFYVGDGGGDGGCGGDVRVEGGVPTTFAGSDYAQVGIVTITVPEIESTP